MYTGGPNYKQDIPSPLSLLGPYIYQVVNYSVSFRNPNNGVHTNNFEATWSAAKRKFKKMNGTKRKYIKSYLKEYIW